LFCRAVVTVHARQKTTSISVVSTHHTHRPSPLRLSRLGHESQTLRGAAGQLGSQFAMSHEFSLEVRGGLGGEGVPEFQVPLAAT